jgi:hypothetical protein
MKLGITETIVGPKLTYHHVVLLEKLFAAITELPSDEKLFGHDEFELVRVENEDGVDFYLRFTDHATHGVWLRPDGSWGEVDLCMIHDGLANDERCRWCDDCEKTVCSICECECADAARMEQTEGNRHA